MTVRIWSLDDEGSGTNGGGVNGVDGTGGSSHGGASGGQKDDDNAIVRAEGRDRFCKGILKGHSKEIYTMTWNTGADGKSVLATCVPSPLALSPTRPLSLTRTSGPPLPHW